MEEIDHRPPGAYKIVFSASGMKAEPQNFDGGLPSTFPDLEVHECARYYADANKLPFSRMNLDVFERLFNVRSVQDVLSSDVLNDDGKQALLTSFEKAKQTNEPHGIGTQNINGALVNPTPEWIKKNRKYLRVHRNFGAEPILLAWNRFRGDGNFEDPSLINRGVSFSISPEGQFVLDVGMVEMSPPERYNKLRNAVDRVIENSVEGKLTKKKERRAYQEALVHLGTCLMDSPHLIENSVEVELTKKNERLGTCLMDPPHSIENSVEVELTEKKERRAYQQALVRDTMSATATPSPPCIYSQKEGRRHRGVAAHIGRLSPPLTNVNLLNSLLSAFGRDFPPTQNWPVGFKVLGMKLLAMCLLGSPYGEEGHMKRLRYVDEMYKDVCGDPSKRAKLHPAFATMDPYDGGASLMYAVAQVRSTDLMKDPLWPYVWCKVWDRLFEIQDEARQEALDSLAKARLEKKLLRRKNALARKDAPGNSLPDQMYAERVRIHDQREAAEREEAKATKELRSRVAEDKEQRSNAQAASTSLPPPLRLRKKKTAVVVSGVEASKRERDKTESLERFRVAETNRRKKEVEEAAEDAVREEYVKIGFSIQCGN